MLRGRVGSDVYSIGKDAKGKRQQVVRSLAETVANPQTQNQMRGRMIMSTIMQAVAALKPIIDHSFDGLNGRQANISEFISRNYALIKADVAANPASDNKFGLNQYQEKGVKQGCYVISDGQATVPAALVLTKATGVISITLDAESLTIGGLKSKLGMTSEEYFTLVGIATDGTAAYERFRVNPSLTADTAISASNIADVFAVEGNATATVALASNVITITLAAVAGCCAVVVTKKISTGFIHSKATLGEGDDFGYCADDALPTYPVGSENFLNGGDIFGQSESFNPGGGDEPSPSPTSGTLTIQTTGTGSPVVKDEDNNTLNSGATVTYGTTLTITCAKSGLASMTVTMNGTSVSVSESGENYVASVDMPSSNATLAIVTTAQETPNSPTISGTTPFETSTQVTISADEGAEIHYTLNGGTPTSETATYTGPITLTETTTIKAIAIKNGVSSLMSEKAFVKQSSDDGETLIVGGQTVNAKGSVTLSEQPTTAILNLPEGSSLIGQIFCQAEYQHYEPSAVSSTLVQGDNTITFNSERFSSKGTCVLGLSVKSGFNNYLDDVWFTINVQSE